MDPKHLVKYLKADFPDLDNKTLNTIALASNDYYHAKNVCRCLCSIPDTYKVDELLPLFGIRFTSTDLGLQQCIAGRDFVGFSNIADCYDGDKQNILYLILRTMGELDKCLDNKYADSPVKGYAELWSRSDIYYMFNHTFQMLASLRSGFTANIDDALVYLSALWRFNQIPSMEVLQ